MSVTEVKRRILKAAGILHNLLSKYRILVFFAAEVAYLELVYRLWNFRSISLDYVFPVLFGLSFGALLFLICGIFPAKAAGYAVYALSILVILVYGIQLIYFCIFQTPLSLYSITGAGDTLQFWRVVVDAIFNNSFGVLLLFLPLIFLRTVLKSFSFSVIKPLTLCFALGFLILTHAISILFVNFTDRSNVSQYTLYYRTFSPELSVNKLGLATTMRLDFERLIFGMKGDSDEQTLQTPQIAAVTPNSPDSGSDQAAVVVPDSNGTSDNISEKAPQKIEFNTMNIDFEALIANEKDKSLLTMHKYFSSVEPTKKNEYTGLFKGDNLILITAEGFSSYAVDPQLTPTLYMMSSEGFVFNNFYNPIWGVSTSDGEYVACTGLIPKSGVWSFAKSGKNLMPFVMGNQFKKLGYTTKAYHDHTYTYYKRDISHPNMGYDYKGVGNGLVIKKTWPESDLEMIEATAGEYLDSQPFHTYYMTVSGHLSYNFGGNFMAKKNKLLVQDLPYSDTSKAYIASNLELEAAMKALVEKLEAAGIAEKTVIAISADHYPYGLPRECIDELAGHKVENNFELYKSTLILWKKGMTPVIVNEPCSSLDIIPTLSNLFGLEYDSRLLMGRDILSDAPPLVILSNRSWITDRAKYNSIANKAGFLDGTEKDSDYVSGINKIVADKFKYSAAILDNDYYRKIFLHF